MAQGLKNIELLLNDTERNAFSMLKKINREIDIMKKKVEKRKNVLKDTGACLKYPVLCVMIWGLAVLSLCGCGKLSGGKNVFQKENRTVADTPENEERKEVSAVGENSVLAEKTENDGAQTAEKPYADMLEKKSEEDIRAYFEAVATEPAAMKENGYVILQWDQVINLDRYWEFEERYLAGQPADLILVQYTEDELPYFDYLYFTGSNVVHFRKQVGEIAPEENCYETYDYLHTFVQRAEERDRYKTLVLSNQKDLTYQEFETLFYQEEPMVKTEFIASCFYVED